MDGDAVGLDSARRERATGNRGERPVPVDPQYRDLIAAGVDGEHIPAVVGDLDRALRGDARAEAGAASLKRRAGHRGQRAIRVAHEPGDRVRAGGVAVKYTCSGAR